MTAAVAPESTGQTGDSPSSGGIGTGAIIGIILAAVALVAVLAAAAIFIYRKRILVSESHV
jgi:hypothetical protein